MTGVQTCALPIYAVESNYLNFVHHLLDNIWNYYDVLRGIRLKLEIVLGFIAEHVDLKVHYQHRCKGSLSNTDLKIRSDVKDHLIVKQVDLKDEINK